jgi:phosphatidylglycerophosphatase C
VLLASASLDAYLVPLGELLGADEVVCTRLERGADGRLTGRLDGANCRGAEKARRVRAVLAERGLEDAELWAYGDSRDDEPLLAAAEHGIRVGRRPILSDLDTGG